MFRRLSLSLLFILLSLPACAPRPACADPLGCISLSKNEPLQLGLAFPLTGPDRLPGNQALSAVKLAINGSETPPKPRNLLGHSIRLLYENMDCAAEGRLQSALNLTRTDQLAVIAGWACPDAGREVEQLFSGTGVVVLWLDHGQAAPAHPFFPGIAWLSSQGPPGQVLSPNQQAAETAYATTLFILGTVERLAIADGNGGLLIPRQGLRDAFSQAGKVRISTAQLDCSDDGGCKAVGKLDVWLETGSHSGQKSG